VFQSQCFFLSFLSAIVSVVGDAPRPVIDPLYANVINRVSLYALDLYRARASLPQVPGAKCTHVFTRTQGIICPDAVAQRKKKEKIPVSGVSPLRITDFAPVYIIPGVDDVNVRDVNTLAALSISRSSSSVSSSAAAQSTPEFSSSMLGLFLLC
jgi:hypothetical protein